MIKNASELLAAFIDAERTAIDPVPMNHMPTLGAAYEAIVSNGIDSKFVLPAGLDLRVVSGFITGLDNQLDCMLVRGEGTRYGRTNQYTYPIDQVLCVLEVKKTLTQKDLRDGIGHLGDVQLRFHEHFIKLFKAGEIRDLDMARETYSKVTGRTSPLTVKELDSAPAADRLLFSMLVRQMYAPATVLIAFGGYKTEERLRNALVAIIRDAGIGKKTKASPELLPSLISVGDLSLVKCNGQPYVVTAGDDQWVAMASARHNAALVLLEVIWTKIAQFCGVKMPFGPEVDQETLECLLIARGARQGDIEGWVWQPLSKPERALKSRSAAVPWEPVRLGLGAISVTNLLALRGGEIDLDQDLRNYIKSTHNEALETIAAELVRSSAFRLRGALLQVIPPGAFIANLLDGTGFVATQREPLEQWCAQQQLEATFIHILVLPDFRFTKRQAVVVR